jgi:hypothetical protein
MESACTPKFRSSLKCIVRWILSLNICSLLYRSKCLFFYPHLHTTNCKIFPFSSSEPPDGAFWCLRLCPLTPFRAHTSPILGSFSILAVRTILWHIPRYIVSHIFLYVVSHCQGHLIMRHWCLLLYILRFVLDSAVFQTYSRFQAYLWITCKNCRTYCMWCP